MFNIVHVQISHKFTMWQINTF